MKKILSLVAAMAMACVLATGVFAAPSKGATSSPAGNGQPVPDSAYAVSASTPEAQAAYSALGGKGATTILSSPFGVSAATGTVKSIGLAANYNSYSPFLMYRTSDGSWHYLPAGASLVNGRTVLTFNVPADAVAYQVLGLSSSAAAGTIGATGSSSPKTGDNAAELLLVAAAAMGISVFAFRKNKNAA